MLQLPFDKKIVIYVGVLSKYQGIDLLIKGVAKHKGEFNDVFPL